MDWEIVTIADAIRWEIQHKNQRWSLSPTMRKAAFALGVSLAEKLILFYLFD